MTIWAGILGAFRHLNRRERRQSVWILLTTFVNATLGLLGLASVLPFFQLLVDPTPLSEGAVLGRAFQFIGVTSESLAIVVAGFLVVGLLLVKNVFGVFHTRITGRFCAALETRLASELLGGIVSAPFGWYLRQNATVLRDVVMTHAVELVRGVVRPGITLANNGLMLLTALALVLPVTPIPALIVVALTLLIAVGLMRVARPKISLASGRKRHNNLLAGVSATEAVTGGRDVRMSRAGDVLKADFRRNYSIYAYSDADARQWQILPRSGIEVIGMAALVAVALLALSFGMDRIEVASMLALYAVIAVRLIPVVGETANALSQIQTSLPALAHLDSLKREIPPAASGTEVATFMNWSRAELRKASYRYLETGETALRQVDLTIKRGQSYGIVGASGAGKSTLADVLAGLLLPTEGEILVDGTPLTDEKMLASWRLRVSYVAQSPLIFDMSLGENISLGAGGPLNEAKLVSSIAAAGLTDVVQRLDQAERTPIGDRGTRLSGGQRQRVAIARALYQEADLMILDEATSALDSLTEQEVGDAIDSLKGRVTVVAIAHRLSTIMHCDEIVLLDQGRIAARGSHAHLLTGNEQYRRFVETQAAGRGGEAEY